MCICYQTITQSHSAFNIMKFVVEFKSDSYLLEFTFTYKSTNLICTKPQFLTKWDLTLKIICCLKHHLIVLTWKLETAIHIAGKLTGKNVYRTWSFLIFHKSSFNLPSFCLEETSVLTQFIRWEEDFLLFPNSHYISLVI